MIHPVIISPPVSNLVRPHGCTRILGSYTALERRGRLLKYAKTFRKVRGGWINKIGLRNPGITEGCKTGPWDILSIAAINEGDWLYMSSILPELTAPHRIIELNLSCPNTETRSITRQEIRYFSRSAHFSEVIAKLPPNREKAFRLADMCVEEGVRYLHFSNTFPSPDGKGGISGAQLREINLPLVGHAYQRYCEYKHVAPGEEIRLIAGGGIYSISDAFQYLTRGAHHLSLSTVFFNNPLRFFELTRDLPSIIQYHIRAREESIHV